MYVRIFFYGESWEFIYLFFFKCKCYWYCIEHRKQWNTCIYVHKTQLTVDQGVKVVVLHWRVVHPLIVLQTNPKLFRFPWQQGGDEV